MEFQTRAAIIFVLILALLIYRKREKLQIQKILFPLIYVGMYRTSIGLKLMDKMAIKLRKPIKYLGYTGIAIGFIGMVIICILLVQNLINLFLVPTAKSGVGLVLPFKVKGGFYVPFFYWIISIFVLVVVHEFAHGVLARVHNVNIKSSGLAFLAVLLPVIPAAFVEPDEKKLAKRPVKEQLSVFAAGSFSNIITAFAAFLFIVIAINPLVNAAVDEDGVLISDVMNGSYPMTMTGAGKGEVIKEIDGVEILTVQNLSDYLDAKNPGDEISIVTNRSSYDIVLAEHPENSSKPYLGIFLAQHTKMNPGFEEKYGKFTAGALIWAAGLFIWIYILNLGIGLFNLIPIPICDGGRMMQLALVKIFDEKKGMMLWKIVGMLFLFLIIINLGVSFIR